MIRVRAVYFDDNEEVERISVELDTEEFKFVFGGGPKGHYIVDMDPEEAATAFHKAGKVPGTSPDREVAGRVFGALMAVVDRFIEYEI